MSDITVYCTENAANIKQTRIKRQWMDETYDAHAYHCFPMTLANSLGYEISFPEDITFVWDGMDNSESEHVKILKGQKYCYNTRSNASLSFKTGLVIKTDSNVTMLQMPVPNYFNKDYQAFTTLISTSFYSSEFPIAIKVLNPDKEITIKAGEPIVTLVPISLEKISNISLNLENANFDKDFYKYVNEKVDAAADINKNGTWTNWYRDATDHLSSKLGNHEVKSIKLKIKDNRR